LETSIDEVLRFRVRDADTVENEGEIRGDERITTPLDDETKTGNNEQAVAISL